MHFIYCRSTVENVEDFFPAHLLGSFTFFYGSYHGNIFHGIHEEIVHYISFFFQGFNNSLLEQMLDFMPIRLTQVGDLG